MSNNISGVNTGVGSIDLECQYDLKNSSGAFKKNLNDDYLADTVTINNVEHSGNTDKVYPTLRFRAKQSGDLSKTPDGRICVSLVEGATGGNASVSVNSFYMDELDRDVCHNGYSNEEGKDECDDALVSYIEFHLEYPVRDGINFSYLQTPLANNTTYTFHHCNPEQTDEE